VAPSPVIFFFRWVRSSLRAARWTFAFLLWHLFMISGHLFSLVLGNHFNHLTVSDPSTSVTFNCQLTSANLSIDSCCQTSETSFHSLFCVMAESTGWGTYDNNAISCCIDLILQITRLWTMITWDIISWKKRFAVVGWFSWTLDTWTDALDCFFVLCFYVVEKRDACDTWLDQACTCPAPKARGIMFWSRALTMANPMVGVYAVLHIPGWV
jgi:hypothetical protein